MSAPLADRIRPEAARSVETLSKAGIQVVMITGDNVATARSIAARCGILTKNRNICLTSDELSRMTDSQLKSVSAPGSINVHNDYLQFLVEHGIIGTAFIVAIFVMTLMPVVRKYGYMVRLLRFLPDKKRPPPPGQIFVVPAPAFILFTGTVFVLIHAVSDCVLRSPANLILLFIIVASIDAYMPEFKIDNE